MSLDSLPSLDKTASAHSFAQLKPVNLQGVNEKSDDDWIMNDEEAQQLDLALQTPEEEVPIAVWLCLLRQMCAHAAA